MTFDQVVQPAIWGCVILALGFALGVVFGSHANDRVRDEQLAAVHKANHERQESERMRQYAAGQAEGHTKGYDLGIERGRLVHVSPDVEARAI